MRTVIGRKQNSNNAQWLTALAGIESLVSEQEVDEAAEKAAEDIVRVTAGKKVAYGWSGGKDATALRHVCNLAGVHTSFWGHSELDFPEFERWCAVNMPAGCETIETPRTYQFLKEHPEALFPNHVDRDPKDLMLRFGPQFCFRKWFELHPDTDLILVGHRTVDGNIPGKDGFVTNRQGVVRYSPIARWPHELVLALCHYKGYELSPTYFYWNGFVNGTHCWNDTVGINTIQQGWQYIQDIDPSIIQKAAKYDIEGAQEWLRSHTA